MTAQSLQTPRRGRKSEICWPTSKPRDANWWVVTVPPLLIPTETLSRQTEMGACLQPTPFASYTPSPASDCLQGKSHKISWAANCCHSVFNLMISDCVYWSLMLLGVEGLYMQHSLHIKMHAESLLLWWQRAAWSYGVYSTWKTTIPNSILKDVRVLLSQT